jgi:hypothetical protein
MVRPYPYASTDIIAGAEDVVCDRSQAGITTRVHDIYRYITIYTDIYRYIPICDRPQAGMTTRVHGCIPICNDIHRYIPIYTDIHRSATGRRRA